MSLKLLYTVVSGDYPKMLKESRDRIAKAATTTMRQAGEIIKRDARASIGAGGFSSRFQNALRVNTYPQSGISSKAAVFVYHKIPWAGQFETPQPVTGQPLLWLPIDQNLPLQARGKRWTPKDFVAIVGPLRSGRRGSRPILFGQVAVGPAGGVLALPARAGSRRAARAREVYNKARAKWVPVFVGVTSVTDPKKFDVSAVVNRVDDGLGDLYAANWEASKDG
jgi:hypothetical protein